MQKIVREGEEYRIKTHRVITMLDRKEMDFLDNLGKDALFSTGHKLSYNDILKGLIDFAIEAGVSGKKINSAETLKVTMLKALSHSPKASTIERQGE